MDYKGDAFHIHNENCEGKSREAEQEAALKRVLLRRKARKIMFEIRNGANGAGAMLTPENCKILSEVMELGGL